METAYGQFFRSDLPRSICYVPDELLLNGKLKEVVYIREGWARLNLHISRMGGGSHLFPNLNRPLTYSARCKQHLAKMIRARPDMFAKGSPRQHANLNTALLRGDKAKRKMGKAEGGSISAREAAAKLGVTQKEVIAKYQAGEVLGWRGRGYRFPVWQFGLPGLKKVLQRLNRVPQGNWGRILFFLGTQGFLGDQRPLDLLRVGQLGKVLQAAEGYIQ